MSPRSQKQLRVAVVVPRFVKYFGEFYQFPLGMAYVAAALKNADYQVFGLNLNHEFGSVSKVVGDFLVNNSIDVVFCGGLSSFLDEITEVFDSAKSYRSNITTIGGGGIVSSDTQIALDLTGIDIGVVGEGELTSVNLLNALEKGEPLDTVKGIVFRTQDGDIKITSDAPPVMDLSSLPRPDYEILSFSKHLELQRPLDHHFLQTASDNRIPRAIDMITSRSCPYSCTFCFHPVGKVYRERPLDDFFDELKDLIKKYDINMVGILDELFSLRKQRLIDFCEKIKPLNLNWVVQLHVHSADEEILEIMKDSGCTYISYGIESMSLPVLHSMQKKTKPERINSTLRQTYEKKIGIQGNLIFFDTAETMETANESMSWWYNNREYQIYLSRLQVFPGSPDYIMANRDNLIHDRIAFSKKLPVRFNISNVNDTNYEHILFQLMVHGTTLLNPPRKQSIERSDISQNKRGDAWNISMVCSVCDHASTFNECFVRPEQIHYFRIFCKGCKSRIDVKNTVNATITSAYLLQENISGSDHYSALLGGGSNLNEQEKIGFSRKSNKELWNEMKGFDKNSVKKEFRTFIDDFRKTGQALKADPFDAKLHINFSDSMLNIKQYGAAIMHYEQAVKLSPKLSDWVELRINEIKKRSDFSNFKNVFFTSLSDEPVNFRKSRAENKPYNRKQEPNFPVYSRSQNRKSIEEETKRLPIFFEKN